MKNIKYFLIFLAIMLFPTTSVYAHREGKDKCLTAGLWVEDSVYNFFDPKQNPKSTNTFEEWADRQMAAWNEILAKSGVRDCFQIGTIVRVRDNQLPLSGVFDKAETIFNILKGKLPFIKGSPFIIPGILPSQVAPDVNNKTVDVQWGFPKSWLDSPTPRYLKFGLGYNFNYSEDIDVLNGTDFVLLHELSHSRYLIDEYLLNINLDFDQIEVTDPNGKPIVGNYLKPIHDGSTLIYRNKSNDLMGGDPTTQHFYASHSTQAFNLIAGRHTANKYGNFDPPSNIGIYLDDLPKNNVLRILDQDGSSIPQASIRIFQSVAIKNGTYGSKKIDDIPDITGTTDTNGEVQIGHNPFGRAKLSKLYRLYLGEREISPFLDNGLFILEIAKNNQVEYKILEVSDFNLAYWSEARERAVYGIKTNFTKAPDSNTYIYIIPTPIIPTPTSTPTPFCTISDTDKVTPIYNETCTDNAKTRSAKCLDKYSITYLCNSNNVCLSEAIDCSVEGKVCQLKPNGEPKCVMLTPIPTPTSYSCIAGGGSCIPSYPCNLGYNPSALSCGGSDVCCIPALTPTPVPTSTPTNMFQPSPTSRLETPIPTPIPTTELAPIPTPTPTSTPLPQQKTIVSITINDTKIDEIDINNNPTIGIRLPGVEGQENTFVIPVIVTYSDGTTKKISLVFNYTLSPTPTSIPSYTPCVNQCKSFTTIEDQQRCYQVCETPYAQYTQCVNQCVSFSKETDREACRQICDELLTPTPLPPAPTQTPTPIPTLTASPIQSSCTWVTVGTCGNFDCNTNQRLQGRYCDGETEYQCVVDPSCPIPTPTVIPGSCRSYKSDLLKCVDDKSCKWTGSLCVDK